MRTLGEISTLLLIAAALAVASALIATVWQRRLRLAGLKMQGYDSWQLWRAVLLESAITIGVGALVGALVGVCGHVLASRWLERTTGFPAPFSLGPLHLLLTLGLIGAISLAVIDGRQARRRCLAPRDPAGVRSRGDPMRVRGRAARVGRCRGVRMRGC